MLDCYQLVDNKDHQLAVQTTNLDGSGFVELWPWGIGCYWCWLYFRTLEFIVVCQGETECIDYNRIWNYYITQAIKRCYYKKLKLTIVITQNKKLLGVVSGLRWKTKRPLPYMNIFKLFFIIHPQSLSPSYFLDIMPIQSILLFQPVILILILISILLLERQFAVLQQEMICMIKLQNSGIWSKDLARSSKTVAAVLERSETVNFREPPAWRAGQLASSFVYFNGVETFPKDSHNILSAFCYFIYFLGVTVM